MHTAKLFSLLIVSLFIFPFRPIDFVEYGLYFCGSYVQATSRDPFVARCEEAALIHQGWKGKKGKRSALRKAAAAAATVVVVAAASTVYASSHSTRAYAIAFPECQRMRTAKILLEIPLLLVRHAGLFCAKLSVA